MAYCPIFKTNTFTEDL